MFPNSTHERHNYYRMCEGQGSLHGDIYYEAMLMITYNKDFSRGLSSPPAPLHNGS